MFFFLKDKEGSTIRGIIIAKINILFPVNQNPTADPDVYNRNENIAANPLPEILNVLSNDGYLPDASEILSVMSVSTVSCVDGR